MKKTFVILIFLILLSPLFCFNNTFADEIKLISNVESGQLTNQDVQFHFEGSVEKAFYSFDNETWIEMQNLTVTFTQEMQCTVFFKATNQESITLFSTSFVVNIDKTPPTQLIIFGVPTSYTCQDVEIAVTANDAVEYSFFGGEFSNINKILLTENTIFEIGDIVARDLAGNVIVNSYPIIIDKIDKKEPVFFVNANTLSAKNSEIISFNLYPIISGIKEFYYIKDGEEKVDIKENYKNGICIKENGEYQFVLISNVDKMQTVTIKFENLGTQIHPWLKNGILIFCWVFIAVFVVWAIILHKKNKKQKI